MILQSYVNISRVAWAIRDELFRVGFFTNQDRRPPQNVDEILTLLKTRRYEPESLRMALPDDGESMARMKRVEGELYADKVRILAFSDLQITRLPRFVLATKWPRVEQVSVSDEISLEDLRLLMQQCPNCAH